MPNVTADLVKQLRDMTGAGMMDCKKALEERGGDLQAAKDWLREKGLARAASKAGRATNEGTVEAYVHTSGGVNRVGVLVEVNCESDFVARTDDFKALAKELALQVAGAMPKYVSREQVPAEEVERERAIYKTQVEGKPAEIVDKIVDGKLNAYYAEVCLLDQPYIRDEAHKKKVSDLVAETVAKLGENISVARFSRFALGESEETTDSSSDDE